MGSMCLPGTAPAACSGHFHKQSRGGSGATQHKQSPLWPYTWLALACWALRASGAAATAELQVDVDYGAVSSVIVATDFAASSIWECTTSTIEPYTYNLLAAYSYAAVYSGSIGFWIYADFSFSLILDNGASLSGADASCDGPWPSMYDSDLGKYYRYLGGNVDVKPGVALTFLMQIDGTGTADVLAKFELDSAPISPSPEPPPGTRHMHQIFNNFRVTVPVYQCSIEQHVHIRGVSMPGCLSEVTAWHSSSCDFPYPGIRCVPQHSIPLDSWQTLRHTGPVCSCKPFCNVCRLLSVA